MTSMAEHTDAFVMNPYPGEVISGQHSFCWLAIQERSTSINENRLGTISNRLISDWQLPRCTRSRKRVSIASPWFDMGMQTNQRGLRSMASTLNPHTPANW